MDQNSVSQAQKLRQASGYLFFLGSTSSKLQYIPMVVIPSLINLVSLGFYLLAYLLWFTGSILLPNQIGKKPLSFLQFKEQYIYASSLGLLATIISITAFFYPVLFIPASWCFFISNLVWVTGEYQKLKNPPDYEENYSPGYQSTYLRYAITMTCIASITALSTSLVYILPILTFPAMAISIFMCIGLGVLAAEYWLEANLGKHQNSKPAVNHSYHRMEETLGSTLNQTSNSPAPQYSDIIPREKLMKITKNPCHEMDASIPSYTPR